MDGNGGNESNTSSVESDYVVMENDSVMTPTDALDANAIETSFTHQKSSSQIPLREDLSHSDEDIMALSLQERRLQRSDISLDGLAEEEKKANLPRRESGYLDAQYSPEHNVSPHGTPRASSFRSPHSLDLSITSISPSSSAHPTPRKSVSFSPRQPQIMTEMSPLPPPPTGTTLSALSDTLLVKILHYLRYSSDLYPVLLLNTRFHQLAKHDHFWRHTYHIYREKLIHNDSQNKITGLNKRARKDFRKHYIELKKRRFQYIERSLLKKNKKTQRKCALIFASIIVPMAYIISIVFGFVLFGLYEDGYLVGKILVLVPFIIALLLYAVGVLVFLMRETVFFKTFFYDSRHIKQFVNISMAPFPHQVATLCFVIKFGLFEHVKGFPWTYAFIPAMVSYWFYYCPCLGALLLSNLRGLHRRRQYVRLKKEHAMELENSVHGDPMTMRPQEYIVDEYNVRHKLSRLKSPNYHLGNDFYLLYFIVSMSVVCTGLMTTLVPLKLDNIIGNPWHVVFIPLWLMAAVFILLIPCWCLYEMLLHGDFKLLVLSVIPSFIAFPLFVSLALITLKADNIAPMIPLCAGMGCFASWLLLGSAAYVFFQSTNLMRFKKPQNQDIHRAVQAL